MSRKVTIIVGVVIGVVALVGLMAWGMANRQPATGRSGFTRVGKPAPDFALTLFGGGDFQLAQQRGKPVIINFWASWCVPCREEAPLLERTWRAYRDKGVVFVGVDIQDSESDARAYLREFNNTYPNGPDFSGKVTIDYGVVGIPVTFFVSKDGVIARRFVGAISEGQLTGWIEELLAGVTPTDGTEESNPEGFRQLR
ncbi:MAG: TlpA family protein disulfide reductase [Chloroflexi bacterium]|nr:TlpA family protein disulfide reductase [Chloroflexota bacterium]